MKNLIIETDLTWGCFYNKGRYDLLYKCESGYEYEFISRNIFSKSQHLRNLETDGVYKLSKKGTEFLLSYLKLKNKLPECYLPYLS